MNAYLNKYLRELDAKIVVTGPHYGGHPGQSAGFFWQADIKHSGGKLISWKRRGDNHRNASVTSHGKSAGVACYRLAKHASGKMMFIDGELKAEFPELLYTPGNLLFDMISEIMLMQGIPHDKALHFGLGHNSAMYISDKTTLIQMIEKEYQDAGLETPQDLYDTVVRLFDIIQGPIDSEDMKYNLAALGLKFVRDALVAQ